MKESHILVAIVAPQEPVRLARIENTLEAKQAVVGGYIEVFPVGLADASGVCNDEGLFEGLSLNRFNPATGGFIVGTFLVAGEKRGRDGVDFCSLSSEQVAHVSQIFGPVAASSLDLLGGIESVEDDEDGNFDE